MCDNRLPGVWKCTQKVQDVEKCQLSGAMQQGVLHARGDLSARATQAMLSAAPGHAGQMPGRIHMRVTIEIRELAEIGSLSTSAARLWPISERADSAPAISSAVELDHYCMVPAWQYTVSQAINSIAWQFQKPNSAPVVSLYLLTF